MNPTSYAPTELVFEQSSTQSASSLDLFQLSVRFSETGQLQHFLNVHVPRALQDLFRENNVASFRMDILECNGVASRALAGAPEYLVTGVTSKAGAWAMHLAPELKAKRRMFLVTGWLGLFSGLFSLIAGHPWLGAMWVALGTHSLRTVGEIPSGTGPVAAAYPRE